MYGRWLSTYHGSFLKDRTNPTIVGIPTPLPPVGNMMLNVVLDGNPLDEDNGNLLDEVILDLMDLLMM